MLCNEAVKQIVAFTQHIGQSDVKKELAIGQGGSVLPSMFLAAKRNRIKSGHPMATVA